VIDQRQPVPKGFEVLHEPGQPEIIDPVQSAVLDQLHQLVEAAGQLSEKPIHRRPAAWCVAPCIHAHVLVEHTFEY